MKKAILLMVVCLAFVSCTEDVRFNNPSFQGVKDNVFWRAIASTASIDATGALKIEAYTSNEIITLKTTSTSNGTYVLGVSDLEAATYVLTDSKGKLTFATANGKGDGQIVITEYDVVNKTISGTFKFNAENSFNNPLGEAVLSFKQGVFYKVPVVVKTTIN